MVTMGGYLFVKKNVLRLINKIKIKILLLIPQQQKRLHLENNEINKQVAECFLRSNSTFHEQRKTPKYLNQY